VRENDAVSREKIIGAHFTRESGSSTKSRRNTISRAPNTQENNGSTANARTYRTGRNRSFSLKATNDAVERLYKLADERKVTLGALLDLALDALPEKRAR
jgi:hypothetical protein